MIDNEEDGTGGTTKIQVNVEDIVKGLGTSIDYAVNKLIWKVILL